MAREVPAHGLDVESASRTADRFDEPETVR